MKKCSACQKTKKNKEFYSNKGKLSSKCKGCARAYQLKYVKELGNVSVEKPVEPKESSVPETPREPTNPKEAKELAMKRMLSSARQRARDKGLLFNLHYEDVKIPNLCPVLKIPLIPSEDGRQNDNSPSLDRMIPYLGYTKGNVKVISMRANRIKTDATSNELLAVLDYVKTIEEENV